MPTFRRRKNSEEPGVAPTNLLPVMNIMFLLIPGLLLAMETASMASIDVSAPRSVDPRGKPPPKTPALEVEVEMRSDSIVVRHGEAIVETLDNRPLAAGADRIDSFDLEGLTRIAGELHTKFPDQNTVTLRAENDIELAELVAAMDALRGPECKEPGSLETADDCWFWQPLIQSH